MISASLQNSVWSHRRRSCRSDSEVGETLETSENMQLERGLSSPCLLSSHQPLFLNFLATQSASQLQDQEQNEDHGPNPFIV